MKRTLLITAMLFLGTSGAALAVDEYTCMWNETPDDFKGNLATLADSPRGKKINKICEKYADWGD